MVIAYVGRNRSGYRLIQWKTMSHSDVVCHWLSPCPKWSLYWVTSCLSTQAHLCTFVEALQTLVNDILGPVLCELAKSDSKDICSNLNSGIIFTNPVVDRINALISWQMGFACISKHYNSWVFTDEMGSGHAPFTFCWVYFVIALWPTLILHLIHLVLGPDYSVETWIYHWLLEPWILASPAHQPLLYWLSEGIFVLISILKKLRLYSVGECCWM